MGRDGNTAGTPKAALRRKPGKPAAAVMSKNTAQNSIFPGIGRESGIKIFLHLTSHFAVIFYIIKTYSTD